MTKPAMTISVPHLLSTAAVPLAVQRGNRFHPIHLNSSAIGACAAVSDSYASRGNPRWECWACP